ncbi:hypothetical protein CDL15_Pgr009971 [Punica granatum]|uniref:Uncharacterized protein n=1 Tax=Punica granatum TaxID=22663 RepID=A0A218XNH8_PUNGR|nr:hypothetical protein CDL15_Pgr009971 [Punica granatum]
MSRNRVVALVGSAVNGSLKSTRPSSVLLVRSWPRLLLVFLAGAGGPKRNADNLSLFDYVLG